MMRCIKTSLRARKNPFKGASFLFVLLFLVCAFGVYVSMVAIRFEDRLSYQSLMQKKMQPDPKRLMPTIQVRKGVEKDIWTVKNGQESHLHIESSSSTLTLSKKKHTLYAEENFTSLTGQGQTNKHSYSFQAEEGFYCFPSDTFVAKTISFSIDDMFFLEADRSHIVDFHAPLPLEGNIRLKTASWHNKTLYALADTASYCPQTRSFVLNGSAQRNVLCWQDGAYFSAPKLLISHEGKNVEAKGDARFSFDGEEKRYFEQIFSEYL